MDDEKRLDLIRKFGPSHVNQFLHLECVNSFVERLPTRESSIGHIQFFAPADLIEKWKDIVGCDACKKPFQKEDRGYLRLTLMSSDELNGWIRVKEK